MRQHQRQQSDAESTADDADLAAVLRAWPTLTPTIRTALAAMATAAMAKASKPNRKPKGTR